MDDWEINARAAEEYAKKMEREVSLALESDYMDHHVYFPGRPYWGPLNEEMIRKLGLDPNEVIDPYNRSVPRRELRTGPYFRGDRTDIKIHGLDFQYYTDGREKYYIISRGPDMTLEITSSVLANDRIADRINESLLNLTYDPSNGTVSRGDLYRSRLY